MAHIAHRHRRYRLVRNTQSERHINLIDRLAAAEESVEKEASVRFRDWLVVGWLVVGWLVRGWLVRVQSGGLRCERGVRDHCHCAQFVKYHRGLMEQDQKVASLSELHAQEGRRVPVV